MGLRLSSRTRPQSSYIFEKAPPRRSASAARHDENTNWVDRKPRSRGKGDTDVKSKALFRTTDAKSFHYSCILGRGVAGTVRLVRHRKTKKFYAMKCMRRSGIAHRRGADRTKREIDVLRLASQQSSLPCPFIIHMFRAFQDDVHIYLLMEYAPGGELYGRVQKLKSLPTNVVRFYIAEIAVALQFLHAHGLAYRDLKPDNVLIDVEGHVLLCDFGLVRPVDPNTKLVVNASAGGSTSYKAPEITRGHDEPHGVAVDWWALGVVCYELFTGKTPFGNRARDPKYEIYSRINKGKIKFSKSISASAQEMMRNLMCLKQQDRWCYQDIQQCSFYADVNWDLVEKRAIVPPWVPELDKKGDHSNFQKWKEPSYPVKKMTRDEIDYSNILGRQ